MQLSFATGSERATEGGYLGSRAQSAIQRMPDRTLAVDSGRCHGIQGPQHRPGHAVRLTPTERDPVVVVCVAREMPEEPSLILKDQQHLRPLYNSSPEKRCLWVGLEGVLGEGALFAAIRT